MHPLRLLYWRHLSLARHVVIRCRRDREYVSRQRATVVGDMNVWRADFPVVFLERFVSTAPCGNPPFGSVPSYK
jgi:hypothetical protein